MKAMIKHKIMSLNSPEYVYLGVEKKIKNKKIIKR